MGGTPKRSTIVGAAPETVATLRDGAAPAMLDEWLVTAGFGAARLTVLERLGGPQERLRRACAEGFDLTGIAAPVAV